MSFVKLDELQWSDPAAADEMQGIHSNSVLFYFMRSPYFDKTSNNNTVYNQALHNASMFPILATRDRFEEFLKSMSGVEYVVHQAPAEMAPGTGTGVWVIRKQLRRKRSDGQPDDLTVYADYFVVGYNVYQAPTLADVLSSRITSMAVALSKAFPAMDSMQTWSPARGHVYEMHDKPDDEEYIVEDEDDDSDEEEEDENAMAVDRPAADSTAATTTPAAQTPLDDAEILDPRLAEESYAIHMMFGGEYMDEQPISGRPGEFHIALPGGGRKSAGSAAAASAKANESGKDAAGKAPAGKDGKDGGAGGGGAKTGGKATTTPTKPKRRKSKGPAAMTT